MSMISSGISRFGRRLAAKTATSPLSKASTSFPIINIAKRSKYMAPRVVERRPEEQGYGGRSSDAGVTVAVFGASGFLGRYVCSNMGANGVRTYMGNRGDEFEMRWLKPCFDLGRAKFVFYSSRDVPSMRDVIADADIVINLVGKYYETKHLTNVPTFPYLKYETNFSFKEANVDVPRTIAELCAEMQVDNLIHVSSLAADPHSKSEWARTKYEGEMAVREAFPWVTVIRPASIFGYEDRLLNWFAWAAKSFPFVPLVDGGNALTQPVFMNDVADVITKVVDDPEPYEGKTIDCFGPADYSYKELAAFVYDITGQEPRLVELPREVVKNFAQISKFQAQPLLTPDMVDLMSEDYIPKMSKEEYAAQEDILTMDDMQVKATPIEKGAFEYLVRYKKGGHFIHVEGYHGAEIVKRDYLP